MAQAKPHNWRKAKWKVDRDNRLKSYAKVVKASRAEMKKQGYDVDYATARKYVSQNVWPEFRGKKPDDIKVVDVRRKAAMALSWAEPMREPDEFIDPRMVGEDEITAVAWFDIDKYLQYEIREIPALQSATKNLRLQVIGGDYGNSPEFTLNDYEYGSTGVREIVERIRADSPYADQEPYASFEGFLAFRQGASDPSDKNSYLIQLILIDGTRAVREPQKMQTDPQKVLTKAELAEIKKRDKEQKQAREAFKALQRKKKERRQAKRPGQKVKSKHGEGDMPEVSEDMTRDQKIIALSRIKLRELEILRSDFEDGIITAKVYKIRQAKVRNQWDKAIDKLAKGGII